MPELTNAQILENQRKERQLIALKEEKEMAELFNYDKLSDINQMKKEVIQVIHRTVAKDTNLAEFAYFLQYCKTIGLDPILKEVWCYKDLKNNVVVFTGKDGFLKLCKKDELYLGYSSAYVCEADTFECDIPEAVVYHKFTNGDRGKVIGAWSKVKSKDKSQREDVLVWVPFSEFDKGQAVWKANPTEMIKKVADCHALKQFAGIPGLQNEYEWKIKDGSNIVTHVTEVAEKPAETAKAEERIDKMIESATSIEGLKKLVPHLQTAELIQKYEQRKQEITSSTANA